MKKIASASYSIILITLFTNLLVACGPAPSPPPSMMGIPEVSVVQLQSGPLTLTSELPGRVTAIVDAQVRPQVTGIIQQRLFEEGSMVKAGQLLYKIDPVTYRAAVDSAKATLARAEASLSIAKLKADRNRRLVNINAISKQDADESDAAVKQAEADLAAAQADLHAQRINLQYTDIKAPVAGRISRTSATIGTLVTANQANVLATIQQLDPIYIDVSQPSLALLNLKQSLSKGVLQEGTAAVDILMQNGMYHPNKGVMKFSEVTVDQATDTVTLRVKAPNTNGDLLPGMYVKTVINMGVVNNAILLSQKAVMRDALGKSYVWVVNVDNVVEQHSINISQAIGNQWLVNSGVSDGDRVIVEGFQKAKPGTKVEIASVEISSTPSPAIEH